MTEIKESLRDRVGTFPTAPGVYLMRDREGTILYVGKARSLRQRVRSYFQRSEAQLTPKIKAMVDRVVSVDFVATGTEVEALLMEDTLVKQHRPRYNVMLRDDKSFPFIKVTNEAYPRVVVTRRVEKDGARYFGPYTSAKAMRRAIEMARKVFPTRTCASDKVWPSLERPCLDYFIKRCPGPCKGHITREAYGEIIDQVGQFLSGRKSGLIRQLKERMQVAASELQYELAATIRDQIRTIDHDTVNQRVVSQKNVDQDVIGTAREGTTVCMAVLRVREGKAQGQDHFFLVAPEGEEEGSVLGSFLSQYYLSTQLLPEEIIVLVEPEDGDILVNWMGEMRGGRVLVTVPQRGDKVELLRFANQNAALQLGMRLLKRDEERERRQIPRSVSLLQEALRLPVPPRRIETFDISNIQGTDPVASMVCFVDGRPRKSDYRKFAIKDVIGPNDFAMMREVVGRRYQRILDEEGVLPDLIVIDGGKGQLSSARETLDELGLVDLPVVGLAKRLEELFTPGVSEPTVLPKTSAALKLLMQARDEAHRFALAFHRQRRSERTIRSELDDIEGVGVKRRQLLLTNLGSVERIRESTVEELIQTGGIPAGVAQRVYAHFHRNDGTG